MDGGAVLLREGVEGTARLLADAGATGRDTVAGAAFFGAT